MNVPDGWKQVDLGSIISVISDGGTPSRGVSRYFGGDIPWIVIDDIKDDIYETTESLTEMGLSACSSKYWNEGTVILSTGATIGVVGITRVKAATKQGICGIEFKNPIDNKYMMYLLKSMRKTFLAYSQGSTIREIRPTLIKKLEVQIPESAAEQRQIARILSKVDEAIRQTEQLIAKYRRLKTGLMQDLLTKGIDAHGNIRSEETHAFKDSPLGRIPAEWDVSLLGQIADFKSGYAFKNEELTEFGTKIIRISNLHKHDFPYWRYNGPVKPSWIVENGDILFSWAGVASSIDCVKYKGENALLNQHIYNFKFDNAIIKQFAFKYIQYFLPKLRLEIEGGAGQLHLTKDKITGILIPALNNQEMERVNSKLSHIDNLLEEVQSDLLKKHSLKTGLMQDLLSGKVRVEQLIREAADV